MGATDFYQRDRNILLRNDRGVFSDAAGEVGLSDRFASNNAIWLDYDRDGALDLYVGNMFGGASNKLYRRAESDGFVDVTESTGLGLAVSSQGGSSGGMAAGDFNGDGWPDLYLGVNGGVNRLFLNDARGGFRDATTSDIGNEETAIGVAVGDTDNDGDLEIFQNVFRSMYVTGGVRSVFNPQWPFRPIMLVNLGEGRFLDVLEGAGLSPLIGRDMGAPGLADIDNDGDLDLLFTWELGPGTSGSPTYSESRLGHFALFENRGDGSFVDRTALLGITGSTPESSPSFLSFSFGDCSNAHPVSLDFHSVKNILRHFVTYF